MARFELHILGCGSATCTLRHNPSCQVLNVHDQLMMIDCGEGAQLEMRRAKLSFSRLRHIFLSHLHGDHCFGLPGLLSTMALLKCNGTVTVHTFAEGAEQFGRMMDYFCPERPYELKFDIIDTHKRVVYEDNHITVTAFPLLHRIPAVGFRFDEKPKLRHINGKAVRELNIPHYAMHSLQQGMDWVMPDGTVIDNKLLTTDADSTHSYAYCSDTRYSKRVISAVRGVEWLYHEATYDDSLRLKAHNRYHSTALEAAKVAQQAGAEHLILGHYSKRYTDETPLLQEAQQVFPATMLAAEGMTIDIEKGH